jgi:hypothetical protein
MDKKKGAKRNKGLKISTPHPLKISTPHTPHPHPLISCGTLTEKRREALLVLKERGTISKVAKSLNICRKSVYDRLQPLIDCDLVKKENNLCSVTTKGLDVLKKTTGVWGVEGGGVGCDAVPHSSKSVHSLNMNLEILELPKQWKQKNLFLENLGVIDFEKNKENNCLTIYFNDCTINIYDKKKRIELYVSERTGEDFEALYLDGLELLNSYVKQFKAYGFKFKNTIRSQSPHFANTKGIFSSMADKIKADAFRIILKDGSAFWIDYSLDVPEEETNDLKNAQYLERLTDSAFKTQLDFNDLNEVIKLSKVLFEELVLLKEISSNLVKLQKNILEKPIKEVLPLNKEVPQEIRGSYFG